MLRRSIGRADATLGLAWRSLASRHPRGNGIAVATTDLGSMYMVAGSAVVLAATGRVRQASEVVVAGSLGWVVAHWAKKPFKRLRPFEIDPAIRLIRPPTGSSFPSGHSTVAAAVATVLAHHSRRRRTWPWAAMIVWVPLTRIQVGVHHPSDVVAGAALGWTLGRLVITPPGGQVAG